MDQAHPTTDRPPTPISPEHEATARRYIEAILERDRLAQSLGQAYREAEAERLFSVFSGRYAGLVSGAYAKPPNDALVIALSAI